MSKELEKNYNPQEIEGRLYEKWLNIFKIRINEKYPGVIGNWE